MNSEGVVLGRAVLAIGVEDDDVGDVDRVAVLDPSDHEAVACGVPAGWKRRFTMDPDEPGAEARQDPEHEEHVGDPPSDALGWRAIGGPVARLGKKRATA